MAWSDAIRRVHARATIFSDLTFRTRVANYSSARILSIDITEELPIVGGHRRVSDCSMRITNDHQTDEYGWTGPTMAAGGSEDGTLANIVGMVLRTYIWEGASTEGTLWTATFIVDGVDADDSGATIHGLGVDSLLDVSFDDIGASPTISAGTNVLTWCADLMGQCGLTRSTIGVYSSLDTAAPRAYTFDGSRTIYDAVSAVAASRSCAIGLKSTGAAGLVAPVSTFPQGLGWPGATSYLEPMQTDRYGTLVVNDPSDGSSATKVLDADTPGYGEMEVVFLSDVSNLNVMTATVMYRDARRWYSVEGTGNPYALHGNSTSSDDSEFVRTFWQTHSWDNATGRGSILIMPMRIEHRYDGGFSQRVYGPRVVRRS